MQLNTGKLYEGSSTKNLCAMFETGENKFKEFVSKRINSHNISLKAPIKRNSETIFAKEAVPSKNQQQIKYLKTDVALFSKLFISSQNISGGIDEFFSYENQGVPPALN